ncbi:MAG: hypothetical protein MO852_09635 [Candidatus Devosia euplotis]|nr:hypothetical protein [Candidatus Devosia euplotis]
MGFYAPSQIIRDATEHGVEVRAVDVTLSDPDCVLEADGRPARDHLWPQRRYMTDTAQAIKSIRLGLTHGVGLAEADINRIVARRGVGYDSIRDLWLRTQVPITALEKLARADAFASLGLSRR